MKSKGEIVATINIEEFEDIPSAVAFFIEKDEEGEVTTTGEDGLLALLNQQHKANKMNAARSLETRTTSPLNALRNKAKADPAIHKKLNAFLAELNLDKLEV